MTQVAGKQDAQGTDALAAIMARLDALERENAALASERDALKAQAGAPAKAARPIALVRSRYADPKAGARARFDTGNALGIARIEVELGASPAGGSGNERLSMRPEFWRALAAHMDEILALEPHA